MPPEIKTPSNEEIEKALKEFEEKAKTEEVKKPILPADAPIDYDMPKMVRFVVKLSGGAIKEQREAEYVLFTVALLIFGVALYFFFN